MSSGPKTLAQIQATGLEALLERLGSGDYTKDRDRWLDSPDVDALADQIEQWRSKQGS